MSLTFANQITVLRILAVPFFIISVLYINPAKEFLRYLAITIFIFAVLSDVIDGYIARTQHQKTKAGMILDPLADKILLMSAFLSLYWIDQSLNVIRFPPWLIITVISRDLILLLGAIILYSLRGELNIESTFLGKSNTCFQVGCILGLLLQWKFTIVFWYLTLIMTIISGLDYVSKGIRIINKKQLL